MDENTDHSRGATIKAVAPLMIVNALAVYGQLAYAAEDIAPSAWPLIARVALAIGFAASVESVALYVGWHAHDALLLRSHATARSLRRWSFLIAACVAAMNYSHFTTALTKPNAAAIAFGMLSLLSPWMWGLHSRRAARIQLLKERRVDDAGAEFSTTRKRAFPIRTMRAYRWSIDNNVTDPVQAWDGYKASLRPVSMVDALTVPTSTALVHVPRKPGTSSKVAAWDVELAVKTLMDGGTPDFVSPKPLQLLRRCVRLLAEGLDVEAVAVKVPCSLAHVQRVQAAMG